MQKNEYVYDSDGFPTRVINRYPSGSYSTVGFIYRGEEADKMFAEAAAAKTAAAEDPAEVIIHDPYFDIYGRGQYVFELSDFDFDENIVYIRLNTDNTIDAMLGKASTPYTGTMEPAPDHIIVHATEVYQSKESEDGLWRLTYNPETELLRLDGYSSSGGKAYFRALVIDAESAFDGVLTAQVVNGDELDSLISELRVEIYMGMNSDYKDTYASLLLSGEYTDGGFTVTLPETPDAQYLRNIVDVFYYHSMISDINANYLGFRRINGYDSSGSRVAQFKLHELLDNSAEHHVTFCYVDRDVSVNGHAEGSGWSLNLKKGWNKAYITMSEAGSTRETTAPPDFDAFNVKWQFEKLE
jgi:hypothetical protein